MFIPWISDYDRCIRCSSKLFWKMLMKSSTKYSSIFRNFSLSPFFQFFLYVIRFITFDKIYVVSSMGGVLAFPSGHCFSVLTHLLQFLFMCINRMEIVSTLFIVSLTQPIFYLHFTLMEVHTQNSTLLLSDISLFRSHILYLLL